MKQIIVLMMSIFMITLCLVGCGNSGNNISGVNPQESVTSTPQAEAKTPNSTVGALISEEEAKKIALQDAGLTEVEITGIRVKLEYDNGIQEYEVDFYAGEKEYDYEIHAETGAILRKDMEIENDFHQSDTSAARISEEEAIKLALEKVPGASEKDVRIHLDHDDGKTIYEGSIVYEGVEYDFEIDADSGVILEWEKEIATG
ncbi:MAG: PepSY domain-containing protein [Oliverpabstia sp.]|nr:PepSY domain-containing protein [Oliverpabstia sp.]